MFEGFSPEAIAFLWGIRFNNNREWFLAHKKEYTKYLSDPLKALGKELYSAFSQEPGNMLKVSRILRDTRMHYEVPYRDSLWVSVRPCAPNWYSVPNLYFAISPEGAEYGFSLWRPEPVQMERFRKNIAEEPTPFLQALKAVESATGSPFTAECYKRPKSCENEALLPYFSWKARLSCLRTEPVTEALYAPALAQTVADFWAGTRPIYDFFTKICVEP